jgi:hypothetical protein
MIDNQLKNMKKEGSLAMRKNKFEKKKDFYRVLPGPLNLTLFLPLPIFYFIWRTMLMSYFLFNLLFIFCL